MFSRLQRAHWHPTCVPFRWIRKQYVEVSESYLEACGATVYFVETPQTHIPDGFSQHDAAYHWQEMEADMPDGESLEDM